MVPMLISSSEGIDEVDGLERVGWEIWGKAEAVVKGHLKSCFVSNTLYSFLFISMNVAS